MAPNPVLLHGKSHGGAWWAAAHGVAESLENPRDGGAWWAAVYGVTQSRTRLKRLSSSSIKRFSLISLPAGIKLLSTNIN